MYRFYQLQQRPMGSHACIEYSHYFCESYNLLFLVTRLLVELVLSDSFNARNSSNKLLNSMFNFRSTHNSVQSSFKTCSSGKQEFVSGMINLVLLMLANVFSQYHFNFQAINIAFVWRCQYVNVLAITRRRFCQKIPSFLVIPHLFHKRQMCKVERLLAQVSSNKEQPAGSGCLVNF